MYFCHTAPITIGCGVWRCMYGACNVILFLFTLTFIFIFNKNQILSLQMFRIFFLFSTVLFAFSLDIFFCKQITMMSIDHNNDRIFQSGENNRLRITLFVCQRFCFFRGRYWSPNYYYYYYFYVCLGSFLVVLIEHLSLWCIKLVWLGWQHFNAIFVKFL